ncbi:hypothetical protein [Anaplasma bovis]|uniref:hypothetical protein n=1 Tax=Anaplasma bovis TaxID=186733 RepID=UPI002FF3E335
MSTGIQKLTQKEMWGVKEEINNLDHSKSGTTAIETKICGNNSYETSASGLTDAEVEGKCGVYTASTKISKTNSTGASFSKLWEQSSSGSSIGGNYEKDSTTKKVGDKTSAKISNDISRLDREQHGVVSSAFAKAHEGAEIVDSTRYTSSMYIY